MQNETLINTARSILKDLINKCSEEEQNLFKRMYSKTSIHINEVVNTMPASKLDLAIIQCENTIKKKSSL